MSFQLQASSGIVAEERSRLIQEQSWKEREWEAAGRNEEDAKGRLERGRQELQQLQMAEGTAKAELERRSEVF